MRLVTFQAGGLQPRVGVLHGSEGAVVDLQAVAGPLEAFASMRSLMAAGDDGLLLARDTVARAAAKGQLLAPREVRLLCPLGRPTLIRDFATMDAHMRNYHVRRARERAQSMPDPDAYVEAERRAGKFELPANWLSVYQHHIGNPLNATGPDAELERPAGCTQLDYELELACVVGRATRNATPGQAAAHIFGYTLMNDFTMRDVQRAENKAAGKSKDFDGSYSFGPCIATPDEVDLASMRLRTRLNGILQAEDGAASMQLGFAQLLSYVSRSCTVHPGEVLASGTFALGCGFELGRLLDDGDVIELEADGIGILRNRIVPTRTA